MTEEMPRYSFWKWNGRARSPKDPASIIIATTDEFIADKLFIEGWKPRMESVAWDRYFGASYYPEYPGQKEKTSE